MWVQKSKAKESALLKVRNDVPGPYAATVAINPSTAYRLLRDFVSLKPGDVIVQNGANSMVGYAVVQLAREMGVKTINIIRGQRYCTLLLHLLVLYCMQSNLIVGYSQTECEACAGDSNEFGRHSECDG